MAKNKQSHLIACLKMQNIGFTDKKKNYKLDEEYKGGYSVY